MEEKGYHKKEIVYEGVEKLQQKCPNNDMKIIVQSLNSKVARKRKYLPTIGKHSLQST